ncbi:unnamed protein product [Rhizophagus irregularis]|nr:unnamed protein product [Rhizophagus irregularis]
MRDARVEELEQKNKELEGTRCCNWTAQNGKQNDILEVTISAVDVPGFLHIPVTEAQTTMSLFRHLLRTTYHTKTITCTDGEDVPSDEMSGLDRNQATEQAITSFVFSH